MPSEQQQDTTENDSPVPAAHAGNAFGNNVELQEAIASSSSYRGRKASPRQLAAEYDDATSRSTRTSSSPSPARTSLSRTTRPPMPRPTSMREPRATPTKVVPRLRRQSTFVNNRLMSVPGSGNLPSVVMGPTPTMLLRRGASFANGIPQPVEVELTPPFPRLRRGSSFADVNARSIEPSSEATPPQAQQAPRLRRGSTRISTTGTQASLDAGTGQHAKILSNETFLRRVNADDAANSLPRAGTFAYGAAGRGSVELPAFLNRPLAATPSATSALPSPLTHAENQKQPALEGDNRADITCGMCGSCRTGSKAMPPWAPERLREMSAEERKAVLVELRAKEEMGRLDAELRNQRLKELQDVGKRVNHRRQESNHSDNVSDTTSANSRREDRDSESQSMRLRGPRRKRRNQVDKSDGLKIADTEDDGDDHENGNEDNYDGEKIKMGAIDSENEQDCGLCDSLEDKVTSLEQQLEVLREVVKLCSQNEAVLLKEKEQAEADKSLKRSKTWMGRIPNPFQSKSISSSERSKLREEVDVLRKATDYLFQKLETPTRQ